MHSALLIRAIDLARIDAMDGKTATEYRTFFIRTSTMAGHPLRLIQKLPIIGPALYRLGREFRRRRRLVGKDAETVFTEVYLARRWKIQDSLSGPGSDFAQTEKIVECLPSILRELGVRTFLDIPCGDFNWMQRLDLQGIHYIGADIVEKLINDNKRFASADRSFIHCDLISDPLPDADLIFCRDCLVHLSHENIFRALRNICDSNIKYLLTTTFPENEENCDIITGEWRLLNLELPPFNFPKPERLIVEGYYPAGERFSDKSLGLWPVSAIRNSLAATPQPTI